MSARARPLGRKRVRPAGTWSRRDRRAFEVGGPVGFAVGIAALLAGATAAAQSPEALGQRLAQSSCAQCHSFAKGEGHGVGPNLYGLLGRPAAAADGFAYSKPYADALKGRTWDAALLDRWLTDTQTVAPGSGMVYFQDDPKKREALIAYLQTLK